MTTGRAKLVAVGALAMVLGLGALRAPPAGGGLDPLSQAELDVSQRVAYVERTLALEHAHLPHTYVVSLAAMSYVVGHISAPQYGYLREIAHAPLPRTAAQAIEMQAGICGNVATTMQAMLSHFHIATRRLNIYYSTPDAAVNGHTTVEVRYGGAWHWFDPTWGTLYVRPNAPQWRVLSLLQVLRLSPAAQLADRLGDDTRLWDRVVIAAGHRFGLDTGRLFLALPHLRVTVGSRTIYRR